MSDLGRIRKTNLMTSPDKISVRGILRFSYISASAKADSDLGGRIQTFAHHHLVKTITSSAHTVPLPLRQAPATCSL
jgi:hypothetical protein